jgi:hypothetical protein
MPQARIELPKKEKKEKGGGKFIEKPIKDKGMVKKANKKFERRYLPTKITPLILPSKSAVQFFANSSSLPKCATSIGCTV